MALNTKIGKIEQTLNNPAIHRDGMSERELKHILKAIFGNKAEAVFKQ